MILQHWHVLAVDCRLMNASNYSFCVWFFFHLICSLLLLWLAFGWFLNSYSVVFFSDHFRCRLTYVWCLCFGSRITSHHHNKTAKWVEVFVSVYHVLLWFWSSFVNAMYICQFLVRSFHLIISFSMVTSISNVSWSIHALQMAIFIGRTYQLWCKYNTAFIYGCNCVKW